MKLLTKKEVEEYTAIRREIDVVEERIEEILKEKIPLHYYEKLKNGTYPKLTDYINDFDIEGDFLYAYLVDDFGESYTQRMPITCLYDENFMEEVERQRDKELAEAENAKKREAIDFKKYEELKKRFEKGYKK